jgi:hypothetical protein
MESLSPHRRFVDPGDISGLPKVPRHTPVPLRDHPLPGTKRLQYPTDDHLKEVIGIHAVADDEPSRAELVTGRGALVCAVALVAAMFAYPWLVRLGANEEQLGGGLFLVAVLVHLLAALSLMLSNWRSEASLWALLLVYGGVFAKMVLVGLLALLAGS